MIIHFGWRTNNLCFASVEIEDSHFWDLMLRPWVSYLRSFQFTSCLDFGVSSGPHK